jgi:MFS family permease
MGLFSFAESPQLQALLADIAPPSIRDATFAVYFAVAFGIGSLWNAVYGMVLALGGDTVGVSFVFVLMAITFVLAALATLPIDATPSSAGEMPGVMTLPTDEPPMIDGA